MKKAILIALIFTSGLAISQDVKFNNENFSKDKSGLKTAVSNLYAGSKEMEAGEFYYKDAIPFFKKAYDFNPNNAALNYQLGICYLSSMNRSQALPYLIKAKSLDSNVSFKLNYNLGLAYHLNMEFEKAISLYSGYKSKVEGQGDDSFMDESFAAELEMRISQSNYAIEHVGNPLKVRVENLGNGINSPYNEYASAVSPDEKMIIFTSRRPDSDLDSKDPELNEVYEDIYVTYSDDNGSWTAAKKMGAPLNFPLHNAILGMSANGEKLIVYSGQIKSGDLFESLRDGESWSEPKSFGDNINSKAHESSACYSADGQTLYFVSDRKGGFGMHDIYYSVKDTNGIWGEANLMDKNINTSLNEHSVFMHPSEKILYFSSEGHSSMGGFDIFKSEHDETSKTWGAAENIGHPINTVDDDVFYVQSLSGKNAYYTSSVGDGVEGGSDLFKVTFMEEQLMELSTEDVIVATDIYPAVKIAQLEDVTYVLGKVTDKDSHEGLAAHLEILNVVNNQIYKAIESDDGSGELYFELPPQGEYKVMTTKAGYFYSIKNFEIPPNTTEDQKLEVELQKVVVGAHITLENVFFDLGKATLRPESFIELNQLIEMMKLMPNLRIELGGHTDSQGSARSNLSLSKRRAESVREYVELNGINIANLESKGYGETQLVNGCKDGVRCSKEQHQENRRTEFVVLGL